MKRVLFFTGSRAEYGLQYPIISSFAEDSELLTGLIVSGTHLDDKFGSTLNEISQNNVQLLVSGYHPLKNDCISDVPVAISKNIVSVTHLIKQFNPDFFFVYADRFESFAALIASTQLTVPTVHIEGGDRTEGGALDDTVRHAMTKLAHFHFVTNQDAYNRVKLLGEEEWRIHNIGLPTLDLIESGAYATESEIGSLLDIDTKKNIVLFTQHAIPTESEDVYTQISNSIDAIIEIARNGHQVIVTSPNNDAGGLIIKSELRNKLMNVPNVIIINSLGRYNYHGLLALNKAYNNIICLGNSSSGIKESAAFSCPTVNIGTRQNGRLRASNVIDVDYDTKQIVKAVLDTCSTKSFRSGISNIENPYGSGKSGLLAVSIIKETVIDKRLIQKKITY